MKDTRQTDRDEIELAEVRRIARVSYLAGWMSAAGHWDKAEADSAARGYEAFAVQLEKTVLERERIGR